MSRFDIAYNIVRKNEGGYVNDPKDPGGETYCGITRRYFGYWSGWKIIDAYKVKQSIKRGAIISDTNLEALVKEFYHTTKYLRHGLDKVNNDGVAALMMDTLTNHGKGALQINIALKKAGFSADEVNTVTTKTISAVNMNPEKAYKAIADQRKEYIKSLQGIDTFKEGLLKRVAKFINNDYGFTWKDAAAGGSLIVLFIIAALLINK